jgi:S1-C subfamily serine protease
MRESKALVACGLVLFLAATAAAQSSGPFEKNFAKASRALARIEFKIDAKLAAPERRVNQAVCIDATNGWFITVGIPSNMPPGELTDLFIVPPRQSTVRFKAKFLGTDPEVGISFLAPADKEEWAKAKGRWTALAFSTKSDLKLGQQVCSVGLLAPGSGNMPYMGMANVGAKLRLPDNLVYVSGGDLTVPSSPVLTADGRAVGLVAGQRPVEMRLMLNQRWMRVPAVARQATRFFMPVEEFAHLLKEIPSGPMAARKLAWSGVLQFREKLPAEEDIRPELADKPAVIVQKILPRGAADNAGIKENDAVIAVDGKPLEEMGTPSLVQQMFERDLATRKPGQTVTLTVMRKKERMDMKVKLDPMPTLPHLAARYYDVKLGFVARDVVLVDRYLGRSEPLRENGVVVLMVLKSSPIAEGKILPGDLIIAVDKDPVPNVALLEQVLGKLAKSNKTEAPFVVLRKGKPEAMTVKLPAAR